MARRLALYFDGHQAAWLDEAGQLVRGELVEFAAIAGADAEVSVIVPGEDVLLTRATLPPIRSASRRLQAARYALEDRLAGRVEQLHFALAGAPDRHGETPVAVVDLARMTALIDTLSDAGVDAVRILPEAMALPRPEPDAWQVAIVDQRIVARTGPESGFTTDVELWPLVAGALDAPGAISVHASADAAAQSLVHIDWAGAAEPVVHESAHNSDDSVIAMLLAGADIGRGGLNLRQGAFARRSQFQSQWRPLIWTAALAATWLVIAIAGRAVETWQLNSRIDNLHQQTLSAFHEAFPNVQNINDLRVQAEEGIRQLRGSGGAGGLFPLVQAVAAVAGQTDALEVQSMQYRNGQLSLSINGEDVQSVETLRAGFAQQDRIQLSVDSADASASGVQIRATVSQGASS